MPELDRKAASVFAGKVVRKDLVRKVKVGANVPVFVLEYLLGEVRSLGRQHPGEVRERFFAYANAILHPGVVRWKRLFHTF